MAFTGVGERLSFFSVCACAKESSTMLQTHSSMFMMPMTSGCAHNGCGECLAGTRGAPDVNATDQSSVKTSEGTN